MFDSDFRRLFCVIRWALCLSAIYLEIADHDKASTLAICCAAAFAGHRYKYYVPSLKKFKWYGIASVVYYFILFLYVISVHGKVFDHSSLFLLFFMFPFFPLIIIFEIEEFRGG